MLMTIQYYYKETKKNHLFCSYQLISLYSISNFMNSTRIFSSCTIDQLPWSVIVTATFSLEFQPAQPFYTGVIGHFAARVLFHHEKLQFSEFGQLIILDRPEIQEMLDLSFLCLLKAHLPFQFYPASFCLSCLFRLTYFLFLLLIDFHRLFLLFYYHSLVLPAFCPFQVGQLSLGFQLIPLKGLRAVIILYSGLQIPTLQSLYPLLILLSLLLKQHFYLPGILFYLVFLLPPNLVIHGLVVDLLLFDAKRRYSSLQHFNVRLLLAEKGHSHGVVNLLEALTIATPWRS